MSNPFADPESFLDYGVRVKDVKDVPVVRNATRQPPSSGATATTASGRGIIRDGSWYVFESLEITPGRYAHIALNTALLDGKKDQPTWWSYAQKTPGVIIPNGVIEYQMMHRLFTLRNDPSKRDVCAGALAVLREDWTKNYPHLGTRIDYVPNSLEATIQHLQPDKTISPVSLTIPAFTPHKSDANWSYLILAKEQPENKLSTMEPLPPAALLVLRGLLGAHAEEAGAVCQYVSPRKDSNLREVRLWVPSAQNRSSPRALVLGVGSNDRFYVDADGSIVNDWPARGVAVREKYST